MQSTKRGRPRSFDKDIALDKAMKIFIEKGFEGASLDDLTEAMGIGRPSMYAAFGNKEELFSEVLRFYTEPNQKILREKLFAAPTLRQAFKDLFEGMFQNHTQNRNCKEKMDGCLIANSTILSCREKSSLSDKIKALHDKNEDIFYERLKLGQEKGELSPEQDVRALAQYFNGVLQGMSVLARAQQSEQALKNIASLAVHVLPVF